MVILAGICGLFAIEVGEAIINYSTSLLPRAYDVGIIESREGWSKFYYVILIAIFFALSAWILLRIIKRLFPNSFLFKAS